MREQHRLLFIDSIRRRKIAPTVATAGFLLCLVAGCEKSEPTPPPGTRPTPRPTPAVSTTDTAALEALRAEAPDLLVDRLIEDAPGFVGDSPELQLEWPTPAQKGLAFFRALCGLARTGAMHDVITTAMLSQLVNRQMENEYRRAVYEQEMGDLTVSDAEIRQYYRDHIDEFRKEGKFTVYHIFLNVIDYPTEKEAKRKLAREIVQQARQGEPFEELAREYSDVEEEKDEPVGPLAYGEINPVLEEAIVQLEPGEISDVVESKYGLNIFKLEDIDRPATQSLESVRDTIRSELLSQRRREAFAKARQLLQARYPVEKHYDVLDRTNPSTDSVVISSEFLTLTLGEIRKRLEAVRPSLRARLDRPEERDRQFDQWIDEARLDYIVEKRDLQDSPEMKALEQYYTSQTLAVYAVRALRDRVPQPTEEEIEAAYKETPSLSMRPEQVRLREIVIGLDVPADATRREIYLAQKASATTAAQAVAELKAGADFVDLVKKYSTAATATGGGDLGFVVLKTRTDAEVAAIRAIEVGQWTQPVERPSGYVIYKLEERKPEELIPLDEARRSSVINMILNRRQSELTRELQLALAEQYRPGLSAEETDAIVEQTVEDYREQFESETPAVSGNSEEKTKRSAAEGGSVEQEAAREE